ncbi:MAG: hypothetical protein HKN78_09075 [Sphingomonadaceae bacterium]|nr:hypothetical protein [Sphingomonadaceae bacterium]
MGYSIEREDDNIVITLSGSMAAAFSEQLVSQASRSGDHRAKLPLLPSNLSSASIRLADEIRKDDDDAEDCSKPDLEAIFGQGFDCDYDEFDDRLLEYRNRFAEVAPKLEEAERKTGSQDKKPPPSKPSGSNKKKKSKSRTTKKKTAGPTGSEA